MRNVRTTLTIAVVTAAALAPAASAHTPRATANSVTTAAAQSTGNQPVAIAPGSGGGEQQSAMLGAGGSLLLSWLGCSGEISDEHAGVAADAGDTGESDQDATEGAGTGESAPPSGGSGG